MEIAYKEKILAEMEAREWTAAKLSEKSGVSETTISRALKGDKDMSGRNLYAILQVLGLVRSSGIDSTEQRIENMERRIERVVQAFRKLGVDTTVFDLISK